MQCVFLFFYSQAVDESGVTR
ncbi:hypothetical protein ACP0HM_26920 [Escherichia coli]